MYRACEERSRLWELFAPQASQWLEGIVEVPVYMRALRGRAALRSAVERLSSPRTPGRRFSSNRPPGTRPAVGGEAHVVEHLYDIRVGAPTDQCGGRILRVHEGNTFSLTLSEIRGFLLDLDGTRPPTPPSLLQSEHSPRPVQAPCTTVVPPM